MSFIGSSIKCAACGKTVYAMERMDADGKTFHKNCMKCEHCKCVLKLGNYAGLNGKYYCKTHFKQLFKLKGNYHSGFDEEDAKTRWNPQAVDHNPSGKNFFDPRQTKSYRAPRPGASSRPSLGDSLGTISTSGDSPFGDSPVSSPEPVPRTSPRTAALDLPSPPVAKFRSFTPEPSRKRVDEDTAAAATTNSVSAPASPMTDAPSSPEEEASPEPDKPSSAGSAMMSMDLHVTSESRRGGRSVSDEWKRESIKALANKGALKSIKDRWSGGTSANPASAPAGQPQQPQQQAAAGGAWGRAAPGAEGDSLRDRRRREALGRRQGQPKPAPSTAAAPAPLASEAGEETEASEQSEEPAAAVAVAPVETPEPAKEAPTTTATKAPEPKPAEPEPVAVQQITPPAAAPAETKPEPKPEPKVEQPAIQKAPEPVAPVTKTPATNSPAPVRISSPAPPRIQVEEPAPVPKAEEPKPAVALSVEEEREQLAKERRELEAEKARWKAELEEAKRKLEADRAQFEEEKQQWLEKANAAS